MDYQKLFEELKMRLDLVADAKLQAAYQYGVQADELAQLVIKKIKTATTSAYDLYEKDFILLVLSFACFVCSCPAGKICILLYR